MQWIVLSIFLVGILLRLQRVFNKSHLIHYIYLIPIQKTYCIVKISKKKWNKTLGITKWKMSILKCSIINSMVTKKKRRKKWIMMAQERYTIYFFFFLHIFWVTNIYLFPLFRNFVYTIRSNIDVIVYVVVERDKFHWKYLFSFFFSGVFGLGFVVCYWFLKLFDNICIIYSSTNI